MDQPREPDNPGLEHLPKLTLGLDRFQYDGLVYEFQDIRHVAYRAAPPSAIHAHSTLILSFDKGRKVQILPDEHLPDGETSAMAAAARRVAATIMAATFNQRVEVYERRMVKEGFVEFGHHRLMHNGDLLRDGALCFNIVDDEAGAKLDQFSVEFVRKQGDLIGKISRFFAPKTETVDISTDKDCFLYIMKYYFGLTWDSQPAPERDKTRKDIFNESILMLGAGFCAADGRVSPEEFHIFDTYFRINDDTYPGASRIFMQAAHAGTMPPGTARRVFELLGGKTELLDYILIGLIRIAAADGHTDPVETTFIAGVAAEFGYSESELRRIFLIARRGSEEARQRAQTGTDIADLRVQYLEVLGLDGSATIVEIKTAYRTLARKHHPDLLRARGLPIDDIANGEAMLKVINFAYEWLSRNTPDDGEPATRH